MLDLGTLEPQKLEALERQLEQHREKLQVRKSFEAWARYRKPEFKPAKHHLRIMREMQEFIFGDDYDVLLLHAPPGSAKSTYVSELFPPFYFANFSHNNILFGTHNADFAARWGRRVRHTITSDGDALGISLSSATGAADQFALTEGGEYYAVGAGAGISGFRADLGLCDDLFGSREDAWSETVRQKRWEWFTDDFGFRLKPGAKRILINTRWHELDVAGRLIAKIESGEIRGKVIDIQAVAGDDDPLGRKPGEYLWDDDPDYAYGADLRLKQRESTPMTWAAMFQQRPAPEDGDYFKSEWIKLVDALPELTEMHVYGASDCAVTSAGGDYTVHVAVGMDPDGKLYLLDLWRKQASSDVWVESLCDLIQKYKPMRWAREKGQITASLGPFMDKRTRERRTYVNFQDFPTRGDKAVRARAMQGYMAMKGLHVLKGAPWLATLRAELLTFPAGRHDDIVDALGLVGQMINTLTPGQRPKKVKPKLYDRWDKAFKNADYEANNLSWKVL
jgi:predicted phage terminase large subunit-like protein